MTTTSSVFWNRVGFLVELFVASAAAIVPLLAAGVIILDRDGKLISYIFAFTNETERHSAYLRVLIILVALIATTIFAQRFLQLERLKISVNQIQNDVLAKLRSDGSISQYFAPGANLAPHILETKKDIVLVGINLTSLLGTYRERINAQLENGRKVTVVIIDPNRANLAAATGRSDIAPARADYYQRKIETSIAELRQMAATAERYGYQGNVKLLLLPYVPTFSIRAFDVQLPSAKIMVEIYPHRTADSPPVFVLRQQSDPEWFFYFRDQMETMLRDGREYSLN